MENGQKIIWTIGHSTRTLKEFLDILNSFSIELVADIRSMPGSNRYPHFNKEALERSLPEHHIEYLHFKDLGGRRRVKKDSHNIGWRKDSFRGYADYMESEDFIQAVEELEERSLKKHTSLMCAEAVWWRCHRSMISDYLKLRKWKVIHILSLSKSEEHPFTQPAQIIDGKLMYPGEE